MSERALSLSEVVLRTRKSKSAIYAGMAADPPTFPLARKDGANTVWLESDIDAYLAALPKWGQSMGPWNPSKKKPLESAA